MPKGPKGEKRPADVIGAAVTVATGALLARLLEDARRLAEVSAILPVVAIRGEILEV